MPNKTTKDIVIDILREQLGFYSETITEESKLREDLCADSLDDVELILAAEEEFGITIEDEDAEKVVTVGDAVKLIDSLLSK
jgi:acyl carrier protein